MVIQDGKTKVAQYGQWGGYPSGQGLVALNFLRGADMGKFGEQLKKCRFLSDSDEDKAYIKSVDETNNWQACYPALTRDTAAEILSVIYRSTEPEIILKDDSEFAADSLFCEWAYVVDLDKGTFEVFKGFNESPLPEGERFSQMPQGEDRGYWPVKLVATFDLSSLPDTAEFLDR